jgi:hypothetical protein
MLRCSFRKGDMGHKKIPYSVVIIGESGQQILIRDQTKIETAGLDMIITTLLEERDFKTASFFSWLDCAGMPIRMGIPARRMRSPWVMMPMGRLSSSTTGIPENTGKREPNNLTAASETTYRHDVPRKN